MRQGQERHGKNHIQIIAMYLLMGTWAMAHADTAPATPSHWETWQRTAMHRLSAMPDPDAKITAAALAQTFPTEEPQVMPLMDRAVAMAPTAADVALLDVTLCAETPGCDAVSREAQLRHVETGNGAFWMMALHQATLQNDEIGTADAIRQLAHSSRFDLHMASLGKRLRAALERFPPPARDNAADDSPQLAAPITAMAVVQALAIPAFQDVTLACKPGTEQPTLAERKQQCRRIAESMKKGDSMIANLVGLRLQEWNARDAADKADALKQRRISGWRLARFSKLTLSGGLPPGENAGSIWNNDREADAIVALLKKSGQPLNPPDDWRAPRTGRDEP